MAKMRFKVPLWVELAYRVLGWLNRRIVGRASGKLMEWQSSLLDKYCQCEKCLERKRTGAY